MQFDIEPSPSEIQAGLNVVVRDMLRPAAATLAVAHLFYAAAHALQLPADRRGWLLTLDEVTVLVGVGLWIYFSKVNVPPEHANRWAGVVLGLAAGDFAYQVYVAPNPRMTVFVVLIVVAAGCFFLSWGWMTASVLVGVAIWTEGMLLHPGGDWASVAHILPAGLLLGLLVHGLRWRSYGRYERLKQQLERTADRLEHRLRFEQVLTRISTRFLAQSSEEIEQGIQLAMQAVGECLGADHVCVCRASGRPPAFSWVYEWCAPEAQPRKPEMQQIPVSRLPWCWERLSAEETVQIHVSDLSGPAETDRALLEQKGIRSFFAVPLMVENRTWGLLGLTTEKREAVWADEAASLLRVLGEIIVAALKRKEAEEEISDLNQKLQQASRLVGLGEMSGNLAHDLGNGVSSILQFTRGAGRRAERGSLTLEQCSECLEDIQEQANHLGNLLAMMQHFIRTRTAARVPVRLPELIHQAGLLMQGKLRQNNITLHLADPPELPPLLADPAQITIVTVNLLLNSVQAMAKTRPEDRRITVAIHNKPADWVIVSVQDLGPGVPAELREKIFERFYTTKKDGLGLGLAFSRTYIEEHGGRLWCEPKTEPGCEFRFMLPVPAPARTAGSEFAP